MRSRSPRAEYGRAMERARSASLVSRVALVTGSSSGIGEAIALELAVAGAAVAVNSRSRERAEPAAPAIESQGGRAMAVAADVCDAAQVASLVKAAINELGGLNILVDNSGAGFVAP
jgi:3-oxoacyl-[acyl-carrier protein] reductase